MLTTNINSNPMIIEEFRNLKTRLEYCSIDKKLKTLVVTSTNAGEGKSTVTSNLSYALAENDKKVVIVDCDLRKPTIHKKFRISNLMGLTDILVGKYSLEKSIIKIKDNIHVITSGTKPPNPVEILGSKAMEELIEVLSEKYDYILFDTPPVKNMSDGQVLAGKVDGTILVVKAEKTKAQDIIKGYEALKVVRANVVGAVINSVKRKKADYYYY